MAHGEENARRPPVMSRYTQSDLLDQHLTFDLELVLPRTRVDLPASLLALGVSTQGPNVNYGWRLEAGRLEFEGKVQNVSPQRPPHHSS